MTTFRSLLKDRVSIDSMKKEEEEKKKRIRDENFMVTIDLRESR